MYFIQCGEYVKIGKSNNVEQRRLALKTGNPYPLNLLGVIECQSEPESYRLENHLHRHFSPWHHEDEWFIIGHQILDFIHTATK